jgi:hypothetical protein
MPDDIDKMRRAFADLRDRVTYIENASGLFASDRELDSQYGDPVVKFSIRDWHGTSYVGKKYSECAPEFLEMLAERLSYSAAHPKEGAPEKYAEFDKKNAQRARSWARRIRRGVAPPTFAARVLAGEPEAPFGSAEQETFTPPAIEVPSIDAPSLADYSDADEDTPTF